ncbi:TPA: phage holin family protein [Enterococcus faecium]|nr:phage holin family protein [Enterococcus faecium]
MIEYITSWLTDDNHMIYGLILWLMVAMIIDFVLGFTIAKFDKEIDFSSFKAKAGIIVKVAEMILVVYFIPVSVKFGAVGITMYVTMLVGLILSEIYSILGHISTIDDNNNWTAYVKKFLDGTINRKDDIK